MFYTKFQMLSQRFCMRQYSSALYLTGDKAQKTFAVLTPYIDFDQKILDKKQIADNLNARKLNINIDKIEKRWQFFRMLDDYKANLEFTRSEIINFLKTNTDDSQETEKLQMHLKFVKNDLKMLKDYSYGIEENAAVSVLNLPNILHQKTPINTETIVYQFLDKPDQTCDSHLVVGKEKNLIEWRDNFCFLKKDAALFELALINYFHDKLKSFDFIQFSNADFTRSIVVAGCGTNFQDNSKVLTLQESATEKFHELSRLHLSGGASLHSFMAYFTKHQLKSNYLPLKLYSIGRRYQPIKNTDELSLFNTMQTSGAEIFYVHLDQHQDDILKALIECVIKIYEPLKYHFRLIYTPSEKLEISESLRLSIQMYSPSLQTYCEVGHLSLYEEYLSKRLLFSCHIDKERHFPKIIAGNILNVHKFLACALEYNAVTSRPLLCNLLKKHIV